MMLACSSSEEASKATAGAAATETAPPADEVDCAADWPCFRAAALECNPARVRVDSSLSGFGLVQEYHGQFRTQGVRGKECLVEARLEKLEVNPAPVTEELAPATQKQAAEAAVKIREWAQSLQGATGTCPFDRAKIGAQIDEFREKWHLPSRWRRQCQGRLFDR